MDKFTITAKDVPAYGDYFGEGESIELPDGYTARVRMNYDTDESAPWENYDGHGVVSEWTDRAKRSGEWVLLEDRRMKRYYAFAESVKIARRDGWDTMPYGQGTKGERAHRATMADFEYLRQWCNGDWYYVGVTVELMRNGETVAEDSCWGIETFKDYHIEWTAERLQWHINADRTARANAALTKRKETRERKFWAYRDVVTV